MYDFKFYQAFMGQMQLVYFCFGGLGKLLLLFGKMRKKKI